MPAGFGVGQFNQAEARQLLCLGTVPHHHRNDVVVRKTIEQTGQHLERKMEIGYQKHQRARTWQPVQGIEQAGAATRGGDIIKQVQRSLRCRARVGQRHPHLLTDSVISGDQAEGIAGTACGKSGGGDEGAHHIEFATNPGEAHRCRQIEQHAYRQRCARTMQANQPLASGIGKAGADVDATWIAIAG